MKKIKSFVLHLNPKFTNGEDRITRLSSRIIKSDLANDKFDSYEYFLNKDGKVAYNHSIWRLSGAPQKRIINGEEWWGAPKDAVLKQSLIKGSFSKDTKITDIKYD